MACPICDGGGCQHCNGGEFEIDGCPIKYVSNDVWELLNYAKLYDKGIPPAIGGALDQAKSFTDGCSIVWAEQKRWENDTH